MMFFKKKPPQPHLFDRIADSMIADSGRIRELEAKLRRAKELTYRPFPKPFNLDTYTSFYVEWCADRERIFGSQSDGGGES